MSRQAVLLGIVSLWLLLAGGPTLTQADVPPGNVVADQFGAQRTPEAVLLYAAGVVVYQGRIDDQFGIGYQQAKPTRRELADALDEVLAGKAVSRPQVPVAGCLIARAVPFKL